MECKWQNKKGTRDTISDGGAQSKNKRNNNKSWIIKHLPVFGSTNGGRSIGSGGAGGYGAVVSLRGDYGGTWRGAGAATGNAVAVSCSGTGGASSGPGSGSVSGIGSGSSSWRPAPRTPGCTPSPPAGRGTRDTGEASGRTVRLEKIGLKLLGFRFLILVCIFSHRLYLVLKLVSLSILLTSFEGLVPTSVGLLNYGKTSWKHLFWSILKPRLF